MLVTDLGIERDWTTKGQGEPCHLIVASTILYRSPERGAHKDSMLLFGEPFMLMRRVDHDWVFGYAPTTGHYGYLHESKKHPALAVKHLRVSHRVCVRTTIMYEEPSAKKEALMWLPMGAPVRVTGVSQKQKYLSVEGGGWIFHEHLRPASHVMRDWVAEAEKLVGTPFHFGGRSGHLGLDCAGLVQVPLMARGALVEHHTIPMKTALAPTSRFDPYARGSLVFWEGHVGVMKDATHLIHATSRYRSTVAEPLATVEAYMREKGKDIISVVRIPSD